MDELDLARWVALDLRRAGFTRLCVHDPGADVDLRDVAEYRVVLSSATDEKLIQRFLAARPRLLAQQISASCRWVKAQPRLGSQYVPDFMVARIDSGIGVRWTLIELQSPTARLFTQVGRPTKQLDEGFRQIRLWRDWISANHDYASKPTSQRGLGFNGLDYRADGLVLLGRSAERTDNDRNELRPLAFNERTEVHSYDWLARDAQLRIERRVHHTAAGATAGCEDCDPIRDLTHPRRRTRRK